MVNRYTGPVVEKQTERFSVTPPKSRTGKTEKPSPEPVK
jgi:hypothetical protein